jgi:hypothetical protein
VGLIIGGFTFTWGKINQRLDDHISLVTRWQREISEWQKQHHDDANARLVVVQKMERMFERQLEINDTLKENLKRVNVKLWP